MAASPASGINILGRKIVPMIRAQETVEWASIYFGGDSMNCSKGIRPRRPLAMVATLFGAMVLTLPAFGQQDMDPTWFNPWDAPKAAVAKSSPPGVAIHHQPRTVKYVSAAPVRRETSRQSSGIVPDHKRYSFYTSSPQRHRTTISDSELVVSPKLGRVKTPPYARPDRR